MTSRNQPTPPNDPDRKPSKQKQPAHPTSDVQNDDFARIGPLSIQGVEASDLPDEGRGSVNTDINHEGARNLPENTGTISGEVGLRGTPDVSDAAKYGGRKKN